jgi:menaquinol-cytochrome c reductase iron-sulfur subunit
MSEPDRRKFLGFATCAIGGGVCVVAAAPLVRLVVDPVSKQTVSSPREPLDLGLASRFVEAPTKVEIVAPVIKDAWAAARDVVLGAAYIRRVGDGLDARSTVCPHLGCAVSFDRAKNNYLCPCHDSRFAIDGAKMSGPSERGLDQLPLQIVNGRVLLTWERYKTGQSKKEPV